MDRPKDPSPTLHLVIDPGKASAETVAEVLAALNAVNRAAGGNGFTFAIESVSECQEEDGEGTEP